MTDHESPAPPRPRKRMLWLALLLPIIAVVVVLAAHVEDWSRDLTTNRAHTAPDQKQQPWRIQGVTPAEIETAARAMAASQGSWELADEKLLPGDSPLTPLLDGSPAATHHFVRTTGLMRYQDDVWLVVSEQGDNTVRLLAESRSRVGKGDLGQNPRNLIELHKLLMQALSD